MSGKSATREKNSPPAHADLEDVSQGYITRYRGPFQAFPNLNTGPRQRRITLRHDFFEGVVMKRAELIYPVQRRSATEERRGG